MPDAASRPRRCRQAREGTAPPECASTERIQALAIDKALSAGVALLDVQGLADLAAWLQRVRCRLVQSDPGFSGPSPLGRLRGLLGAAAASPTGPYRSVDACGPYPEMGAAQ